MFIEELTEVGILGTQILFWLCIFNVLYVSIKNLRNKSSFIPKSTKEQIVRFLVVGIGNICLFTSFQYISAASYSTLTRIDIPIIIVVSALALKQMTKKFYLSLFVLLVVGLILVESQRVDEEFIGYILVIFGVFGKVVNTLLKKKMSTTESMEIIILVGSLSGLIWSSVLMSYQGVSPIEMNPVYIFEIIVLSLLNLTLNYSLIHLFRRHSAEAVRFPYIIAAVLTMVLEMLSNKSYLVGF